MSIYVDLDGTLAHYDGWVHEEFIGDPIRPMLDRVKGWLKEGKEVVIFTARVEIGDIGHGVVRTEEDVERIRRAIELWCEMYIGQKLPITNIKSHSMSELWDDRAIRVVRNTGESCCSREK